MAAASAAGEPPVENERIGAEEEEAEAPADRSKLRILGLHGFRTSGKILGEQVKLAKWSPLVGDIAEFVFMDAPWPARGPSDVEGKFAGPYYEWYQSSPDRKEVYGVDEASAHISDYISLHGPFDGILGFSQGAVLAAALLGFHEKGLGPQLPSIKFLIVVGGGKSRANILQPAFSDPITCHSLHMIGDKDFLKESGEKLVICFQDPVVIRHPYGHFVPRLGTNEVEIFRTFLLKQLQSKLTPSEDESVHS